MNAANETAATQPGRLEVRGGVAWLVIDEPGKKVNTLSRAVFAWFERCLVKLESEPPQGVVVVSGKANGFIAGADISELQGLTTRDEVVAMVREGHELTRRFQRLPCPKVAALHGAALGGGLELALCCDYRVATDDAKTRLGLPEVQLGLVPGLGGTQRLPRLIGVPDALDLILTGRQVVAKKALKLGLVDEVCAPQVLGDAALRLLAEARAGRGGAIEKRRGAKRPAAARVAGLLARLPLADRLVYEQAKSGVLAKTGGHYPAPLVAIDVVREGLRTTLAKGLEIETGAFAELVLTDVAANLMSIFFMKNDVEARAAKTAQAAPELDGPVGVLGAGLMGAGIAQVLAQNGVQVVMKDRDHAALGRGVAYVVERFLELVQRRRYRPVEAEEAAMRVWGTVDYGPLARVPLVVEAVFEEMEVKHAVLREIEAAGRDDLVFASNTSTLPIAEIAAASRRPERVVGMHFFSPVHKMPLVEVIRHPGSDPEVVAAVVALGRRMGKTVIVVDDGPGFFTSRVLGPFMNEATWILAEGARVEQIDRALTRWGFPVGPMTLMDEVGLDVAAHAGETMLAHFGDRVESPPVLGRLIEDGRTGRKGGRGFYRYDGKGKGKKGKKPVDESVYELIGWERAEISEIEIAERCWLQMLNETARCIEVGVIENPVDIDVGVIFGFGFPPFRGGLLREADRVGLGWVVERLDGYAARYGRRLEPAGLLREMAEKGERFHDR
jgi:3-hydroxyacyl-CoA dehydrogenase/enoyl-CoA hydratase/3-hydroxybutyryl-CoA epimerase